MTLWRGLPALLFAAGMIGCAPQAPDARPAWPPLGLPAVPVPSDNALTLAKIELGKKLFFDRRISFNNTMSCAMCHVPEQGFTANELATAIGVEGRSLRRNAPTLYNVAYHPRLFHDGREATLENQIWGPLVGNEMANPSVGFVIERIASLDDYRGRFEAAFAGKGVSIETLGQAIAAYERTVISGSSRFDRWHYGKQVDGLNTEERLGFQLFTGKARCAACHTVSEKHALFSDFAYHNTGIGWKRSRGGGTSHRVELAPGLVTQVDPKQLDRFSEKEQNDVGRFEITLDPKDLGLQDANPEECRAHRALHARRLAGDAGGCDRVLRPRWYRQPGARSAAAAVGSSAPRKSARWWPF